jgi:hypothetical protein
MKFEEKAAYILGVVLIGLGIIILYNAPQTDLAGRSWAFLVGMACIIIGGAIIVLTAWISNKMYAPKY